jgi:ATP-dependent helicase/DNAse subunit B
MHVRFLLGPAGSGKTFRCLAEIRDALLASPDGPPLLFLAPKQATFQLERQLLDDPALSGYTRLRILSFERLAEFVFHHQNQPRPELLDEEGRVMVLRALLTRKREELRLFRASARLPGFAEQLSRLLRELQQHQLTPSKLGSLAARVEPSSQLAAKLHDLASMQRAYFDWLKDRNLEDADRLPDLAAALLKAQISNLKSQIFEGLWLDGFAQMTPQELELLAAVAPHCRRATLAFCLEAEPQGAGSWLSMWTLIGQTFQLCRERLRALMSEGEVLLEVLPRDASRSRFRGNAALQHLERHWAQPRPFAPGAESQVDIDMESNTAASVPLPLPAKCERGEDRGGGKGHADKPPPHAPPPHPSSGHPLPLRGGEGTGEGEVQGSNARSFAWANSLPGPLLPSQGRKSAIEWPVSGSPVDSRAGQPMGRLEACPTLAACTNSEGEAIFVARKILRFVREGGGRFRDCAVLLRSFEGYAEVLRRIFQRYEIPFFLDRRESVAHHPLAELTRYALRTVAFGWQPDDWFGALKSGLAGADETEIDRLENEALARGWRGAVWWQQIRVTGDEELSVWLERLRQKIVPPFHRLDEALLPVPARNEWREDRGEGKGDANKPPLHEPGRAALPRSQSSVDAAVRQHRPTIDGFMGREHGSKPKGASHEPPPHPSSGHPLSFGGGEGMGEGEVQGFSARSLREGAVQTTFSFLDSESEPPLVPAVLPARKIEPTGAELADALRKLWNALKVDRTLERWTAEAATASSIARGPSPIHETVWAQMNEWLQNLERAFPDEPMPLTEWLPVVEAGLSHLSVGVIPPALDQVVIGTIDRSRNPDLRFAAVLGMNEGVFPAPPAPSALLSQSDRQTLASFGVPLGPDRYEQIGVERFYAYIACTRAREKLILTYSKQGADNTSLIPSSFLDHLKNLFPDLQPEDFTGEIPFRSAVHTSEAVVPLLKLHARAPQAADTLVSSLAAIPSLGGILSRWKHSTEALALSTISSELAARMYGGELHTSVSALEDFAACPFKYFAARGLRAEERMEFEADYREKGSFQHEVLREFHARLQAEGKRWRDLAPERAREFIRRIGAELLPAYRQGLFLASPSRHFAGQVLLESLGQLAGMLVSWAQQYQFDPQAAEVSFGLKESRLPAWRIDLDGSHALLLRGRIDRVDICRIAEMGQSFGVVIDYKSSARELEAALLYHGLELQLLAYLGALTELAEAGVELNAAHLHPAGAFYVALRASGGSAATRDDERAERERARQEGFQHRGRFDAQRLDRFDNRQASYGDQFKYTKRKDGTLSKRGNDALPAQEFQSLLARIKGFLRRHGQAIYAGRAEVAPYRWRNETACDFCVYRPVCRFDPWTQPFRVLRPPPRNRE